MKYFPRDRYDSPLAFELRASVAEKILLTNAVLVAGIEDGEDSTGRQRIRRLTPRELVDFAFALADEFVGTAEARDDIKIFPEDPLRSRIERLGQKVGELETKAKLSEEIASATGGGTHKADPPKGGAL